MSKEKDDDTHYLKDGEKEELEISGEWEREILIASNMYQAANPEGGDLGSFRYFLLELLDEMSGNMITWEGCAIDLRH